MMTQATAGANSTTGATGSSNAPTSAAAMAGFPMMQNPMAPGMNPGMTAPGTDSAAAQN